VPAPHASEAAAAAAPVREGWLTGADGVQLRFQVVGSGKDTVVVLHGGPVLFSSSYLVRDFAPLVPGRTLIFFDQRGAGRSGLPADTTLHTAGRFVADLEAVRQHFGLAKMSILGHSWGAMLAGLYAIEHPTRVERMVLANPAPIDVPAQIEFLQNRAAKTTAAETARQDSLFPLMFGGPDPVGACEAYFGSLATAYMAAPAALANFKGTWCDVSPQRAAEMWFTIGRVVGSLGNWDFRQPLGALGVPTLVVHGAGDPIPLSSSQAWASSVPGGRLVVIGGTGHFPWLENPDAFFEAVNPFLRRSFPQGS
jgi:proline iminopeptidase